APGSRAPACPPAVCARCAPQTVSRRLVFMTRAWSYSQIFWRDRRPPQEREKFCSKILPPYLRKTKSVEKLLPLLYLKGISTGDFNEALLKLLGPDAKGLSATTITRLKGIWQDEYEQWNQRSLKAAVTARRADLGHCLEELPRPLQPRARHRSGGLSAGAVCAVPVGHHRASA